MIPPLPFPFPLPDEDDELRASLAAACTHPPGAAPKSTMAIPGRMSVLRDFCCNSTNLNADRETKDGVDESEEEEMAESSSPEARARTKGSDRWRWSHWEEEPDREEAWRVRDQEEGEEQGVARRGEGTASRDTAGNGGVDGQCAPSVILLVEDSLAKRVSERRKRKGRKRLRGSG